MNDLEKSQILKTKPIGHGLDRFRDSFRSTCRKLGIDLTLEALRRADNEVQQNLALDLISALLTLQAPRALPSRNGSRNLFVDLSRLNIAVSTDNFDPERIAPLLLAVICNEHDEVIWGKVYALLIESTPPPPSLGPLSIQQTPWLHNTGSFANSSEHRKYIDDVLKEELGTIYVGVPGFWEAFFGPIAGLETAAETVFNKCNIGEDALYQQESGWRGWPKDAKEKDVLSWFAAVIGKLQDFAKGFPPIAKVARRPLAQPKSPIQGSTAERKLDIGFVDDPTAGKDSKCHWSHILVPGELKSNPASDTASKAWLDLGRYTREVLAAQDTRRFVVGFTLCGSLMRLWVFDRLGGIASDRFDINSDGMRFVKAVLGYLWMNEEQLGFDPTVTNIDGRKCMKIERNGRRERLVIERVMLRTPCIVGRATTCWKGYREGDVAKTPLVIKDSWQFSERDEEGELLRDAARRGVVNVARYYHHETVCVGGKIDDIRSCVRKDLDITQAANYRPETNSGPQIIRKGRSSGSIAGQKRSSSSANAPLPPKKRSCSQSPTKTIPSPQTPNRVHRRVIVRDYGKPIYKASSRVAMLAALKGCIEGHESLHSRGKMLQRDISINNLLMNEDQDNPSWPAFLIDLDLAVHEERERSSGARSKTGTRAFMAIGVLYNDEPHSFMHDLESFFWVLFWICIHYDGIGEARVVPQFDTWNYTNTEELAKLKLGTVSDENIFHNTAIKHFSDFYRPLIPWLNKLRKVVFPGGGRWKKEDGRLYFQMKDVLRKAMEDPNVVANQG